MASLRRGVEEDTQAYVRNPLEVMCAGIPPGLRIAKPLIALHYRNKRYKKTSTGDGVLAARYTVSRRRQSVDASGLMRVDRLSSAGRAGRRFCRGTVNVTWEARRDFDPST